MSIVVPVGSRIDDTENLSRATSFSPPTFAASKPMERR